jgi:hypothetical protein
MGVEAGPKAGLESQNDLAYLLGEHGGPERDRQVRTAEPRRASTWDRRGEPTSPLEQERLQQAR